MNLLQKQDKYREYLKKLEIARQNNDLPVSVNDINQKTDILLDELKDNRDTREYNILIWMLAIPLIGIVLASNVKYGNWIRLIPLLLLILYIVFSRLQVVSATKKSTKLKTMHNRSAQEKKHNYLQLKIQYLLNSIRIKIIRIRLIQIYYFIFFPVFLLYLADFLKGNWPFGNIWISVLGSMLIGGLAWIFVFNPEIIYLSKIRRELNTDLHSVH